MYYKIQEETLEDISKAIKVKSGTLDEIKVEEFAQAILSLNTGEDTKAAAESASDAKASAVSALSNAQAAAESAGMAANDKQNVSEMKSDIEQNVVAAANSEANAAESAIIANDKMLNAEAWAVGQRNGIEVTSDDDTYENNAKYWCDKAKDIVGLEEMPDANIQSIWDNIFM